ncbi:MAG TPA: hypothetical protein VF035_06000 [Longimicrobiales bacterium]
MTTQWVNTQPDAGAVHALLASVAERVGIDAVDQIWIFPTRRIAVGESTVIVFALCEDDPDRRRVLTARFTVTRDKKGVAKVQDRIDEHGSAPVGSVERVVEGVLRRLGEDIEQPPRNERIDRSFEAWTDLLTELGAPRPLPDEG